MIHKAWSSIEEVPYCFSRSSVKFQGHTGQKNRRFWPKFGVSGLYFHFELVDGNEMKHKAWSSWKDVPYCFSRSSVKFWCHMGQKTPILTQIEHFRTVNPVWIHQWLWKAWHSIEEVPYCFLRSSIKFPSHTGPKINDLNPILSKNTRPVAAIKSLRFALFWVKHFCRAD